jgi:hypothetical protein
MNIDRQLEINDIRRERANDRYLDRIDAAQGLIGELCRDGRTVYYTNLRSRDGRLTGKTKEGSYADLLGYLVRNRYV